MGNIQDMMRQMAGGGLGGLGDLMGGLGLGNMGGGARRGRRK